MLGNRLANRSTCRQCVVARLPSCRPAVARANEPAQIDAVRRAAAAYWRIAEIKSVGAERRTRQSPPRTRRGSGAAGRADRGGTPNVPPDEQRPAVVSDAAYPPTAYRHPNATATSN